MDHLLVSNQPDVTLMSIISGSEPGLRENMEPDLCALLTLEGSPLVKGIMTSDISVSGGCCCLAYL